MQGKQDNGPKRRTPKLAGSWYPFEKDALRDTIKECFTSPLGPGTIPTIKDTRKGRGKILATIVPHAGLRFSGPIAAHGFHAIMKDGIPDTIILVASHGGFNGIFTQSAGSWQSPMGRSEIDEDLVGRIIDGSNHIEINNDFMVERTDNTFELQLPFIHFISLDTKIVPIAAGTRNNRKLMDAGEALARVLKEESDSEEGKRVIIVSSTDLTHYGAHFNFMPARGKSPDEQNEWVRQNDMKAVNDILHFKEKNIGAILDDSLKHRNICCPGAIILTLHALKALKELGGINKIGTRLLKHATSHDIDHGAGFGGFSAVGYASVVFDILGDDSN
ncbi:AmmeMemoRadiSam system protein B [Candidatus Bathyarchaeota archaeon]|nr:AmmeMemoRadiSam system protein B [Candidatus Bathyarchaeota archaeon]